MAYGADPRLRRYTAKTSADVRRRATESEKRAVLRKAKTTEKGKLCMSAGQNDKDVAGRRRF